MRNATVLVVSVIIILCISLRLAVAAEAEAPSPSPAEEEHIGEEAEERGEKSSRGGLSGSKKAGIAIGVIVAASVIVLAGLVYKKRNHNIRRSQYAYAVRREFL
ncbi:hypothetical protein VNO78_14151 [Psophocarpus tetragonolobus]|uniref:Transmembrane protein n=1 Tax=Psophocarpus tetragonolobus TaxID=3891 RepID=A0AAN9XQ89_PSOTE